MVQWFQGRWATAWILAQELELERYEIGQRLGSVCCMQLNNLEQLLEIQLERHKRCVGVPIPAASY